MSSIIQGEQQSNYQRNNNQVQDSINNPSQNNGQYQLDQNQYQQQQSQIQIKNKNQNYLNNNQDQYEGDNNTLSPQKRSNLKPPMNGNKSSEKKSKLQNAVKLISALNSIQQRNQHEENNDEHNDNDHHGHTHHHNLDISQNQSKQKNYQERMLRERIKAAEKSFVVGRIKADDSRISNHTKRNKTEISIDDQNADNNETIQNLDRQKSSLNINGKKQSDSLEQKKDQRNNSQGFDQTKHQKKINNNLTSNKEKEKQNNPIQSQSSSNLKKTPTSLNLDQNSENQIMEINLENPSYDNAKINPSSQNMKEKADSPIKKFQIQEDHQNRENEGGSQKQLLNKDDKTQLQNNGGGKILLKLNRNQSELVIPQITKKVQMSSENMERNKNNDGLQNDLESLNQNNNIEGGSKSPTTERGGGQRRQIRSYSSKGFGNNNNNDKSKEKLNKSNINKNKEIPTLPSLNNIQSKSQNLQSLPTDSDASGDSHYDNSKSKLTEPFTRKRSSYSQVNIHEKKLIDEGLKLKKYNNMDLILSKITKTHNQRGNPYQDPLTQQIFTKQFTEVFVKKMEKKRKNQKKTDYDYIDAAKVYYSVCDGSSLSKPEIGRGQKYLLDLAQKKSNENQQTNTTQNDKKMNEQFQNQTINDKNNQQSQSKISSLNYPQLQQSESSPTIITGGLRKQQYLNDNTPFGNENPELSQQSFRTTQNGLSPEKKFQPLFMGARNNTQISNENGNSFYHPMSTSTTHSFYPHSHFHRLNPLAGISAIQTQRDRSPFNMSSHIADTNYGQPNNYTLQDINNIDKKPYNNDQEFGGNGENTQPSNNNDNLNSQSVLPHSLSAEKNQKPTQFTSDGKLILPKLTLNPNNTTDPDLQNAVKCSKILQYLNNGDIPNLKKKKAAIDPAEREKSRQRLLGNKESQPKSIRQLKEEERKRQDDEKFNGPKLNTTNKGKNENTPNTTAQISQKHSNDNSILSAEQSKPVKKIPKFIEEYQNFSVSLTQNYNETASIVLKRGYPEENDSSLLKVDQLSKDNFKNFQWKFDEVWVPQNMNDTSSQRYRVLKGRDEKIKQKCSFHFFNCSDLGSHKDYLKDVSVSYMINLKYEKDRVRNPTLLMYSIPNIFQQNKKELEFVTQQEYYSTLESILEYRYQIRQEWQEEEMISIFYSLLDSMNELSILNIAHGNITPANIAYSYKTNRYKIFNFSSAQVLHKDYRGGYPIYYQWPFIAPEVKKGLSFNSNKSNKYDILASDLYSLGISFLMIKYLIPENLRSQEAIQRLISTVESDDRLSGYIIKSLINKQQTRRVENTYSKLCRLIHQTLTQQGQTFSPYQKQDLVNLNPLHKLKWKQNKDSEVIADYYYRIFQWQNAADRLKKLLDELLELEKGENPNLTPAQKEKKQRILRDVWKSFFKQQEYDNAVKYNQMYMELLSQTPEDKAQDKDFLEALCDDLKMTGQLYFTVQQPDKAIHYFDKTIQALTQLHGPNHIEVVSMLNNIGVLYKSLSNYTKSLEYFQQAQQIMENSRNCEDDLYFFIKYNIGIIYFEQEELTQAENILYDIYKIKTSEHRVKSVEVSQYAYVLGNVYIKKNHLPKAQQIIQIAIKMRESCIGYDGELIKWKQLLANVCFQLGQRKEAMDILIKTVQDVKKMRQQPNNSNKNNDGDDNATYNAIEDIGNLILETGNKKEALKFYHEALQLAKNQQEKQTGIISALEKKIKEVKK